MLGAPAASSGGLFGATTPAPTFGSAATNAFTPSFGFGAASTAASTPAIGGFGAAPAFGAASTSSLGTSAFGSFGASSTPSFGSFGATSAAALASSSSLFSGFGSPSPFASTSATALGGFAPATSSSSLFQGGFAVSPASGMGASLMGAAAPAGAVGQKITAQMWAEKEMPLQELQHIEQSYNLGANPAANPHYRFRALFLNVVGEPSHRTKPMGVDELKWREAMLEAKAGYGANLWPVQACGFADLEARLMQQEAALTEDQKYLEGVVQRVRQMQRARVTRTRERIERVRETHQALQHTLLRVMGKVAALEALPTRQRGLEWEPPSEATAALHRLREQVQHAPASLPRRVAAVAAAARMRDRSDGVPAAPAPPLRLAEESMDNMNQLLLQENEALLKLKEVVQSSMKDLAILKTAVSSAGTGNAVGNTNRASNGPTIVY